MANAINTVKSAATIIAKTAAAMLEDKMQFIKTIDKEPAESFSQVNGYNPGDTINISKPARFTMNTTADITSAIEDVVETKVPLALTNQRNVPIALTSAAIATDLSLKSWMGRILDPAMTTLGNGIEAECLLAAANATANTVGTPGSTVFDVNTMMSARSLMMKNLCPQDNSNYFLGNSDAIQSAVNANKGLFQQSTQIGEQYLDGQLGRGMGFNWLENNLISNHTNGNDIVFEVRTTVSVQGQATLVVEALTTTTGTVTKGTSFTIAGVNAVHPVTKQDLGYLQEFVTTSSVTADASGYATLDVYPAFYTSAGPTGLQNITAFPVDGAAITTLNGGVSTTLAQNLAYNKKAFRFVSVPLVKPDGLDIAAQETVGGITVRVIRDYAVLTDQLIMRLDVLYGFVAVRPEWACKVTA